MATAKKETAKKAFKVISPLQHDLVDYEVGSTVELTGAEAAPLLGHTVVLEGAAKAEAPAT